MSVPTQPLGELTLVLAKPLDLGCALGLAKRVIAIESGKLECASFSATVVGPSADWFGVTDDKIGLIDGRLTLDAGSGLVQVTYGGRADYSGGWDAPAYAHFSFDTSIEALKHLNRRLVVGIGTAARNILTYELALLG